MSWVVAFSAILSVGVWQSLLRPGASDVDQLQFEDVVSGSRVFRCISSSEWSRTQAVYYYLGTTRTVVAPEVRNPTRSRAEVQIVSKMYDLGFADEKTTVTVELTGWPRAFGVATWILPRATPNVSNARVVDGLLVGRRTRALGGVQQPLVVPLRVLPTGLAIQGVIAACVVAATYLAGVSGIRYLRRKRSRCVFCAYDLRGISTLVCPECGNSRS